VLQFVAAVCCSVMKSAVVCCSVLQCAAVNCSLLQCAAVRCSVLQCAAVCCSALQRVAVRCSVLQCVAVYCSALQYVAVCSSMLQRATSVLQYVAVTICSHATHTVHNIGRTYVNRGLCTPLDAHVQRTVCLSVHSRTKFVSVHICAQDWTHTRNELFIFSVHSRTNFVSVHMCAYVYALLNVTHNGQFV